jgi:hypothetical protein
MNVPSRVHHHVVSHYTSFQSVTEKQTFPRVLQPQGEPFYF